MPCYEVVRARAQRLGIQIPPMKDEEVRQLLGAIDHDDVHRILAKIGDEELRRRLQKGRKQVMEAIC